MHANESYPEIEKYITDDELEFDWEYPFQGGLEIKVRINNGEFKTESKVGIEIGAHGGYLFDVYGNDGYKSKGKLEDVQKATICIEGDYEKRDFIQAMLKLALFLKLNGYTLDGEIDEET
tara:strand:- start:341 stop:700 length:360 start_codon:yes stop_codon:yes gene_type:complete